jgi:hypothetical protein
MTIASVAGLLSAPAWGQNYPPPPPQYPPQQYPAQQYPPASQQYPPQQQYPPPYDQQQPSAYPQQPPSFAPQQLDAMTGRIALYPDPLLAQVLTAATFSDQIPDADGWARSHAYLGGGDALARAIQDDRLPWDPSILALLPFPSVLDMMAGDMGWTQQLGNAVLADREAVMDSIQRERSVAMNYGYLRTNDQVRVQTAAPGDIEIVPVNPSVMYVPYYDPYVVYARPRPGFFIGGAISFGPRVVVGSFAPWGWGATSLGWRSHAIVVNNRPWVRTWTDRPAHARPAVRSRPEYERHELREYRAPERHEGGRR